MMVWIWMGRSVQNGNVELDMTGRTNYFFFFRFFPNNPTYDDERNERTTFVSHRDFFYSSQLTLFPSVFFLSFIGLNLSIHPFRLSFLRIATRSVYVHICMYVHYTHLFHLPCFSPHGCTTPLTSPRYRLSVHMVFFWLASWSILIIIQDKMSITIVLLVTYL